MKYRGSMSDSRLVITLQRSKRPHPGKSYLDDEEE